MERPTQSLDGSYFERIYADSPDPWGFETSDYERDKYANTIAHLPRDRYRRGLEIGCSIGVLTGLLAQRCDQLVSTEINAQALERARQRNAHHVGLDLRLLNFPEDSIEGTFDLVVLSEVAYYWGSDAFVEAQDFLLYGLLEPGAHLLLVHYTPHDTDYPRTGDRVHEAYLALSQQDDPPLRHLAQDIQERYRLDLFERLS